MKCMDSDIMYVIHVYNDIWNATSISAIPHEYDYKLCEN